MYAGDLQAGPFDQQKEMQFLENNCYCFFLLDDETGEIVLA